MAERKIFNHQSVILTDMTVEQEGYHPGSLGRTSSKFVHAVCRYCGKPSRIRLGFFNKSRSACHQECRLKEQSEMGSPFKMVEVREKSAETNLKKYGVEHASSNSKIANKISASKRRKKVVVSAGLSVDLFAENKKRTALVEEIAGFVRGITSEEIEADGRLADVLVRSAGFGICANSTVLSSEAVLATADVRNLQINRSRKCEKEGIRLLHVFDLTWQSRRLQVESIIRNAIGENDKKVAARKCIVSNGEAIKFIDEHHIQGSPYQVSRWFNLMYDGQVVSSMTASKHHRQNVEGNPVVLSRFCSLSGCSVQGGASKLFEALKTWAKDQEHDRVLSWSDNTYAVGGLYGRLGFALQSKYPPDYFYWDSNKNIFRSKQSQKKSAVGCPAECTERVWAKNKGLYRLFDCGKKLWVHTL